MGFTTNPAFHPKINFFLKIKLNQPRSKKGRGEVSVVKGCAKVLKE
jgi:hypothetical protein